MSEVVGNYGASPNNSWLDIFPNMTSSIAADLTNASNTYGIPLSFLATQAEQESSLNPNAVNGPAEGIGQFMPGTAQEFGLTNPFDPAQSINAMAEYDSALLSTGATYPQVLNTYGTGANEFDNQAIQLGQPSAESYFNPLSVATIQGYAPGSNSYAPGTPLTTQMQNPITSEAIANSVAQGVPDVMQQLANSQSQEAGFMQQIAAALKVFEWPFQNPLRFGVAILALLIVLGVAWHVGRTKAVLQVKK